MIVNKQQLLDALSYPCWLVLQEIDLEACPHGGYYNGGDHHCRSCKLGPECQWLSRCEDITALSRKPVEELVEAFGFAIGYIDFVVRSQGHRMSFCKCDMCSWLRSARWMARQFEPHPEISERPMKS